VNTSGLIDKSRAVTGLADLATRRYSKVSRSWSGLATGRPVSQQQARSDGKLILSTSSRTSACRRVSEGASRAARSSDRGADVCLWPAANGTTLAAAHYEDADSPSECQFAMVLSFCSQIFDSNVHIPSYRHCSCTKRAICLPSDFTSSCCNCCKRRMRDAGH
jgi:hypothetical protein